MNIKVTYHILNNAKEKLKNISTNKQNFKQLKRNIYNYISQRTQSLDKSELVESTMYQFNIYLNMIEYVIVTFKNGTEYWILRVTKYKTAKEYCINNPDSLSSIVTKVAAYLRPKLRAEQKNLYRARLLHKLVKKRRKYLSYKRYYRTIARYGWVPIIQYPLIGSHELTNDYSQKYLDKFFSKLLLQHNKKLLNYDLKGLIHNLNNDISMKLIKSIINNISGNTWLANNIYKLFPNILFPVLEHILYLRGIRSSGRTSELNSKVIVGEISKINKSINIHNNTNIPDYNLLRHESFYCYELVAIEYLYKSYNNNQNNNQILYSRNSVLHGRFNLDRVHVSDYLKLILLCYNLSLELK